MSICVVSLVDADRALVAVDTATEVHGHAQHFESSKMHLFPLGGLVLVGMGRGGLAEIAFRRITRPGLGVDFDLCAGSMQGFLECALQEVDDIPVSAKLPPHWYGMNLTFLVGWSRTAGRMQARAYLNMPGEMHVTEYEVPRWAVQPRDWSLEITPPTSIEEIQTLAWAAVRHGKSLDPDCPFGGRLVIAEIRRDSISTHVKEANT